jgi:glucosamine-6-phosphate deaminase
MGRDEQTDERGVQVTERTVDGVLVHVFRDRVSAGSAAGRLAEEAVRSALMAQGQARVVFASAQSQREMLAVLRSSDLVDWGRVTTFQMDEYLDLLPGMMSLSQFLDQELLAKIRLASVNKLEPGQQPPEAECKRYEQLLRSAPIDLVCLGIGESGHLAYNDPPAARFDDDRWVRVVNISEVSRQQSVNDGHFGSLTEVPSRALTMTIPALLSARKVIGTVPGTKRHDALRRALDGPIDEDCPASALRTHHDCTLMVDLEAYEGTVRAQTVQTTRH